MESIHFPEFFEGCRHGFFSQVGGVSKGLFAEANMSFNTGDDDESVLTNRTIALAGLEIDTLVAARQVHGADVFSFSENLGNGFTADGFDALVTDQTGVGLLIQTADCQPVFLYDAVKKVIGAVHSGWRGSVANVVSETVKTMSCDFGCIPEDISAAVGPSLGPCCAEFINFRTELPVPFHSFMVEKNHFDFWEITRHQLLQCGLDDAKIVISGICTACNTDYFSYRRACRDNGGVTGRNGSIIALI